VSVPEKTSESITPVDVHVGQMMRGIRRGQNMAQETFAAAMGVTFQQIQKYELGKNRVSASKMYLAAQALGVPPAAFFDGLAGTSVAPMPNIMAPFFAEDGSMEIAQAYLKLSTAKRRILTDLVVSMAD
jgi:transcriptional regulator with XRE-family HTH domain